MTKQAAALNETQTRGCDVAGAGPAGRSRRDVGASQRGAAAGRLSAVLRLRRWLPGARRRRPRIYRLHVQLGAGAAWPSASRSAGGGRGAGRPGRLFERPGRGDGGSRRRFRRDGAACRLGDVPEERRRRDHRLRDHRAGRDRAAQGAGREGQLSRRAAMVLAERRRRHQRGPRASAALRIQRRREPAGGGRGSGQGSCRDRGDGLPARYCP